MPVSINKLNPGDVVYDVKRERAGNTTMMRQVVRPVYIREVKLETGVVIASWNGNPPKRYYAQDGKLPFRRSIPQKP